MKLHTLLIGLVAFFVTNVALAAPIGKKPFEKVIYVAYGVTSTESAANSGGDYSTPKGFYDGDLMAIDAGMVIEQIFVVVDTTVADVTAFNLGDDDTASGFVASSSPTLTAGSMYFWEVDYKGAYLKGGDLVSDSVGAKYYSAAGKELKLDVTGTATAGKLRVVVKGYQL